MFAVNMRHFLDRGHNQAVIVISTLQFADQNGSILCVLYYIRFSGKATIFIKRLYAQLNTIHKEYHFVRIA